jgi:hypothetical protein
MNSFFVVTALKNSKAKKGFTEIKDYLDFYFSFSFFTLKSGSGTTLK